VNAVRLRMSWREVAGLTPDDHGTFVERVLAQTVLGAAVEAHNQDVRKASK
jgi:hypothetical protein